MRKTPKDLLQEKKALLFDLDGTLVDSMWMWKAIDIEFLGRFGYGCPDDLQRKIEGMSFTETAAYFQDRFQLPMTLEEIKACWTDMSIEKYRNEVPLKEGAFDLLEYCRENKVPAGIATSNGRDMVEAVLGSLKIRDYFQTVATACEVAAGKPEPDIYLEAARRLQVPPADCLVFEDIPAGILAGKRAGMAVIAVEDPYSKDLEPEKRELSDGFIRSYKELFE